MKEIYKFWKHFEGHELLIVDFLKLWNITHIALTIVAIVIATFLVRERVVYYNRMICNECNIHIFYPQLEFTIC